MALDKVVDSVALDAGLAAIADAIRTKSGTAEPLTWPDGFITAIAGIQSGGANGIYVAQVTPETDLTNIVIQHNLNTTDILLAMCVAETLGELEPAFAATLGKMWSKTEIVNSRNAVGFSAGYRWNTTNNYAEVAAPNTNAYYDSVTDENTFTFTRAASGTTSFLAGVTYTVIIVANAEV